MFRGEDRPQRTVVDTVLSVLVIVAVALGVYFFFIPQHSINVQQPLNSKYAIQTLSPLSSRELPVFQKFEPIEDRVPVKSASDFDSNTSEHSTQTPINDPQFKAPRTLREALQLRLQRTLL